MEETVQLDEKDHILVARLGCKDFDYATREDCKKCFKKIIEGFKEPFEFLALNLKDVCYIRSILIGLFLELYKDVVSKNKILILANVPFIALNILEILGMDELVEIYPDSIEHLEEDAEFYYRCGNNYFYRRDHSKAIKYFTRAIELRPENAKIYFARGICHKDIEQDENALKDFKKYLELEPKSELAKRLKELFKEL